MGSLQSGLGTGVYGSRLAAKLANVTLRQLRYWVKKGLLEPSIHRAARGGRDLFAYTDLVQARTIGRLRAQRASLQKIAKAIAFLRTALPKDEAWHTKTLVLYGDQIVALMARDELVSLTHQSPGQKLITVFLGEVANQLTTASQLLGIGKEIEVDTRVQGGSPVIRGTRIPTKLIGDLLDEGVEPARIVRMYPGITPASIDAAQEFERQLAAV